MKNSSDTPPPLYNSLPPPLPHQSTALPQILHPHTLLPETQKPRMSGNDDYHFCEDDSPQHPEDYRGYEHHESNLILLFNSPTKENAQEGESSTVPTSVAKYGRNSIILTAIKAKSEVKEEEEEGSIPIMAKAESGAKEEIKKEVKEEPLSQIPLQMAELSEEEHAEEVERNGPKILQARHKIERIFRRSHVRASQSQLFKKFKRLIRSGNCQGPVIDAIWDEWRDTFPSDWTPYRHGVRKLKAEMNEDRHQYGHKATW